MSSKQTKKNFKNYSTALWYWAVLEYIYFYKNMKNTLLQVASGFHLTILLTIKQV